MSNSGLILYAEDEQTLDMLTEDELRKLLRAMFREHAGDTVTTIDSDRLRLVWPSFRHKIISHREKWISVCERNRRNGSRGGRPAAAEAKPDKPSGLEDNRTVAGGYDKNPAAPTGNPEKPTEQNRTEQNRTEHIPKPLEAGLCDVWFRDVFWKAYPKKVGKPQAERAARKAYRAAGPERVMAALERDRGSGQWNRDGGEFIPHPATWLNREPWEDGAAEGCAAGGDGRQAAVGSARGTAAPALRNPPVEGGHVLRPFDV